MKQCVITSAARTAVGAYLGSLKDEEAQDLGAAVIREAARRSNIGLDQIDQVILGEYTAIRPMWRAAPPWLQVCRRKSPPIRLTGSAPLPCRRS